MTRIVFVDPQDISEKHWWPAVVVDPLDYTIFFREMGEPIEIDNEFLVCYFEDASYSSVQKEEIIPMCEYLTKLGLGNILDPSLTNNNYSENNVIRENGMKIGGKDCVLGRDTDLRGLNYGGGNAKCNETDSSYVFTQFGKDTNKWLNSRSIRAALKLFKEGKIPLKFKWLKKKASRKYSKKVIENEDPGIRKKKILERAYREFKDLG